jgi:hypothetical protein
MESLPQWDALSEGARDQLMHSVTALLLGDTLALTPNGDSGPWDELRHAGVVRSLNDTAHALILTGPGTCLVLDALQASGRIEHLAA